MMLEHLQQALVEVYYAVAEFNEGYEAAPVAERAETCARLMVVRANLEKILVSVQESGDQGVETKQAA